MNSEMDFRKSAIFSLIPKSKYFSSTMLSQIKCRITQFALFAELGYVHFILQMNQHYESYWVSCSLSGKGEGRKSKGNTVVLWYPPRCCIKDLFIIQILYIKVVYYANNSSSRYLYIFLPSRTHSLVGEMDLWLLLSGYLMHSSDEVCLKSLPTIWVGQKTHEISCPINSNS